MSSMKKVFENETQTRINLIGPSKSGKSTLISNLARSGVFTKQNKIENNIFPTEVLYCSPRNNYTKVYLDFEEKNEVVSMFKKIIFNLLDESFMEELQEDYEEKKKIGLFQRFKSSIEKTIGIAACRFFNLNSISELFKDMDFNKMFSDFNEINIDDNIDEKNKGIWETYFKEFEDNLNNKYDEWITKISKYYIDDDSGCRYENEYNSEEFFNNDFNQLLNMIYNEENSCGLIIKRAYMEIPAAKNEYTRSIFIDYNNKTMNKSISSDIANRVSEDYKELFVIVGNCNDQTTDLFNIKGSLNRITLSKRVFCILNKFDLYRDSNPNIEKNSINLIKTNTSKGLGIKENRIIITERFMDIDKNSLEVLQTNREFVRLFRLIKAQSQHIRKPIKIRSSSKENIITIKLNQERMSVQALMNMLYDRYNGYLVGLWEDIINNENDDDKSKKYYYNCVRNIIKNRKDDFKEFKCENKGFINYNKAIDFTISNGDYNDGKKIIKMLVNYGYHTVGFNSRENKILVSINGEISKEDKENLIKSITGRLEESVLKYFENAFLIDISKKKFNVNSLKSSLEF